MNAAEQAQYVLDQAVETAGILLRAGHPIDRIVHVLTRAVTEAARVAAAGDPIQNMPDANFEGKAA